MRLISLTLNNFKGIKSFTLDAQGQDIDVFGDNATGKTTLADAFMWLLFDKDSQNRKDFQIKTLGHDGEPEHGLEHSVEATLQLADGKLLTLKKVFSEKWTKKRGSATAEFTGHTTDYYLDGVPVKKSEYEARIANIASEDIFKLLASPTYFNEHLHWKERREILLQVCGDITDEEVIASDKSLAKLPEILNGRKLEDHRKVIQARRTEINKELEKIPVRISEAELAMPDIGNINAPDALEDDISNVKGVIQKKNQGLALLVSGGEVAEKTKRLREIEAEIIRLQSHARAKHDDEIRQLQEEKAKIRERMLTYEGDIESLRRTNKDRKLIIGTLRKQIDEKREQWYQESRIAFEEPEQSNICPTCRQRIPEEILKDAILKAFADFNRRKAEKLEQINEEGKQLKIKFYEFEDEIKKTDQAIAEYEAKLKAQERELENIDIRIESLRQETETMNDPELQQMIEQKTTLEEQIESLKAGSSEAREKIQEELQELNEILSTLESCREKLKMHKQLTDRIEELKEQERRLAAEYEQLEQELYLTEEFIRRKVSLLEDKINSKFEIARFKLFNALVNGAIEECCETTYQGVPFSSLNNGARINVGLDIIRTLAKHYNFYPPIFIDNREAVTKLIDMGKQQVINLIVSEQDKELRIEIEDKKQKEVA